MWRSSKTGRSAQEVIHPRERRFIAAAGRTLGICAILVTSAISVAGKYVVTYSGGGPVHIVGPDGNPWTQPYTGTTNPGGRGGSGVSSNYAPFPMAGVAGPGSVSCAGKITATLQWTADNVNDKELPPKTLVIKKYASASWSGDSGTCANGLGHPVIGDIESGSSSGTVYEVVTNPGTTLTRDCTPTANAVVNNPPQGSTLAASAGVLFKVTPIPIKVVLTGVYTSPTDTTDKRILLGQRLMGTVDRGEVGSMTDTYTWNVGGGDPFYSYSMATSAAVLDNTLRLNLSPLYVAFRKKAAMVPITCSVYLTMLGTTVTAEAKLATKEPEIQWPKHALGTTQLQGGTTIVLDGAIYTKDNGTTAGPHGIIWGLRVKTPVEWTGGQWAYVQLVKPGRKRRDFNGVWTYCGHYGAWVLDNSCPYSSYFLADNSENIEGDKPSDSVAGFQRLDVEDYFNTYSMYEPPHNGVGRYHIAIHRADWYWKGIVAQVTPGVYALTSPAQGISDMGYWMHQPTWSAVINNANIWPPSGPGGGGPGGGSGGGAGAGGLSPYGGTK